MKQKRSANRVLVSVVAALITLTSCRALQDRAARRRYPYVVLVFLETLHLTYRYAHEVFGSVREWLERDPRGLFFLWVHLLCQSGASSRNLSRRHFAMKRESLGRWLPGRQGRASTKPRDLGESVPEVIPAREPRGNKG